MEQAPLIYVSQEIDCLITAELQSTFWQPKIILREIIMNNVLGVWVCEVGGLGLYVS